MSLLRRERRIAPLQPTRRFWPNADQRQRGELLRQRSFGRALKSGAGLQLTLANHTFDVIHAHHTIWQIIIVAGELAQNFTTSDRARLGNVGAYEIDHVAHPEFMGCHVQLPIQNATSNAGFHRKRSLRCIRF
jgi:hypothetical protein